MLIDAYEKGVIRIIIDNANELTVFKPFFIQIRINKDELHKGMIDNFTYECDPYLFDIFFREQSYHDMHNSMLISQITGGSTKNDIEQLEITYNYCKSFAEFLGVLNDTIRIEVDIELREDQMKSNGN